MRKIFKSKFDDRPHVLKTSLMFVVVVMKDQSVLL